MQDHQTRKQKRGTLFIAIFAFVALASGWVGVLVDRLLPSQPGEGTLGMGVWLILPFLCGVVIRTLRKDWASFGIRLRLRGNLQWYGLAALVFPAVTVVFALIGRVLGVVSIAPVSVSSVVSVSGALFIGLLIKNVFEDFAWQGFLMPKMVSVGASDALVYLVVGLVWAFWHAPYYLYFLPDTYDSTSLARILDVLSVAP